MNSAAVAETVNFLGLAYAGVSIGLILIRIDLRVSRPESVRMRFSMVDVLYLSLADQTGESANIVSVLLAKFAI